MEACQRLGDRIDERGSGHGEIYLIIGGECTSRAMQWKSIVSIWVGAYVDSSGTLNILFERRNSLPLRNDRRTATILFPNELPPRNLRPAASPAIKPVACSFLQQIQDRISVRSKY
jgi:hypothetical protein